MSDVLERTQPATLADLERLPEGTRAELIDGTLYTLPTAALGHQRAMTAMASALFSRFDNAENAGGGWWIYVTPELQLGLQRILVPDLAGWRRSRSVDPLEGPRTALIPDWVAEIRSPSTASHDMMRKAPLYREAGVQWMWIVDPHEGFIEVYAAEPDQWRLDRVVPADDTDARLPPFDASPMNVRQWFGARGDR